jgi:hypothetical protein
MKLEKITDEVRHKTLEKLLKIDKHGAGRDLYTTMFSFMQIRETLYSVLEEIEINEVKKRWNK